MASIPGGVVKIFAKLSFTPPKASVQGGKDIYQIIVQVAKGKRPDRDTQIKKTATIQ